MTKKTFKQIYEELDSTPPKTKWIRRIAKVTMRSELTVRMWLNGRQTPEPLVQKIIAKELGVYETVKRDGGWQNVSSKDCGNIVTKAIEIANRNV